MAKFALIGVGGYIARKHLKAIYENGCDLVVACDLNDSVGIMDKYFKEAIFTRSESEFFTFIANNKIDYLSICTPNHEHFKHIAMVQQVDPKVKIICEKPLLTTPDHMEIAEKSNISNLFSILQLRKCKEVDYIKNEIRTREKSGSEYDITVDYNTPRGPWYEKSWKGNSSLSGGLLMNIGVHLFDLIQWIYEEYDHEINIIKAVIDKRCALVKVKIGKANVVVNLSIEGNTSPCRRFKIRNSKAISQFDIGESFTDLHTECYNDVLCGSGIGFNEAFKSIKLIHRIEMFNN